MEVENKSCSLLLLVEEEKKANGLKFKKTTEYEDEKKISLI